VYVSRIPVQELAGTSQAHIAEQLVTQWLEHFNTPQAGSYRVSDSAVVQIHLENNAISPEYAMVAGVTFLVKPFSQSGGDSWFVRHGTHTREGWTLTSETFGVYREGEDYRLAVLGGWGT
jgi:hypothetical protein